MVFTRPWGQVKFCRDLVSYLYPSSEPGLAIRGVIFMLLTPLLLHKEQRNVFRKKVERHAVALLGAINSRPAQNTNAARKDLLQQEWPQDAGNWSWPLNGVQGMTSWELVAMIITESTANLDVCLGISLIKCHSVQLSAILKSM
mmetsp:Transcript_8154/g.22628  ORF Transcript_8154/g.22628 Transcript_8154/m.22628 type:complete len:144 (-) Transcript_8154:441-872(-)